MKKDTLVSFIVIAYNAGNKLASLLEDLKKQSYNHNNIEIILVDSSSSDNTKDIMNNFKNSVNDFMNIKVLDNPKKVLPSGWNVALKEAKGEIILRVDAHSSLPEDFIEKNVKYINEGEKIVGGHRISIIDEDNKWQRVLLTAEKSLFGSGIAAYRRSESTKYVKTLAHAAYSKEVFDNVGMYNEKLFRTEDNEMHYRMREKGYKFYFNPDIVSYHHARNEFSKMCKQKYLNGYWIGLTMGVCPKCFSIYHLVPFAFVIALIIFSLLASIGGVVMPLALLCGAYAIVNLGISLIEIVKNKFLIEMFALPFILLSLHICYGVGTLVGFIKLPSFLKNFK
ncbi:glycosyltransferase family 2 protein [Clostridium sp. AL.422]|uniref:glycosyltransferase family 2 protein n=1 Tax=Clostridium TaxID=1485 RepID=UPI00293DFB50|nr:MULTISPECIES: glycosyltransferase family 2 protein [unclassified Clostridium]MDV4150375.1 glycosyltransferase family 2 protein [Clostridium sp. AL.422]